MKKGYTIEHEYFVSVNEIKHVFVFNWFWCNGICNHYADYSERGDKREDVIGQWNVKHKQ